MRSARGEVPVVRESAAPHLVLLRHRAEIELGALVVALGISIRIASDSVPRLAVVVLVLSSAVLVGVREMVLGQIRRIVMPRRLRRAFVELGVGSRHRHRAPAVIGSAARPDATEVRVALPVGITAADLAAQRHRLAELCFVDAVVIERRPGRPDLVDVVLVHRSPGRPT